MLKNSPNSLFYFPCLLAVLLFSSYSCSNSYTGRADIGARGIPEPGKPFFTVTTSSNVSESGETQALVFLSINENSLIFKREGDSLISKANLNIEIHSSKGETVVNKTFQMNFFKDSEYKYYDQNQIVRHKTFNIPPGKYEIIATLTDLQSGKQTSSENDILVPDPTAESVFISNIRFYEKISPAADFSSINTYDVNAGFDSLKFSFQITNGRESESIEIQSNLIRFRADTDPALSMSDRNPRRSTIKYKGLDYSDRETIQSNTRILETAGSVTIENSFTDLERGNYRFEVQAKTSDDTFFEIRDFSIKSEHFPQLKTARELARPLVYLMTKNEYNKLLQIKSEDSLKSAIDTYWLKNIRNVHKAKTILQLYYDRVEQANIQFSNFKEGWKTDPGMIYILFGPPLYTDEGFGEMTWFYEFDSGSRTPSIYFEDTRYGNIKFPFENYLLQRSDQLFSLQYRQIQAWNDGSILFLSQ